MIKPRVCCSTASLFGRLTFAQPYDSTSPSPLRIGTDRIQCTPPAGDDCWTQRFHVVIIF
jgi:hypothetical protein